MINAILEAIILDGDKATVTDFDAEKRKAADKISEKLHCLQELEQEAHNYAAAAENAGFARGFKAGIKLMFEIVNT